MKTQLHIDAVVVLLKENCTDVTQHFGVLIPLVLGISTRTVSLTLLYRIYFASPSIASNK